MYTVAAVIYLVCAVLLCAYVWWLSRPWFGVLKSCIRIWLAIILFIPSQVADDNSSIAPAFIRVIFTTLTDGWDAAKPHVTPLLAALSIATIVILSVALVNYIKRPKQ